MWGLRGLTAALGLLGCGRLAFDPLATAASDAAGGDAVEQCPRASLLAY